MRVAVAGLGILFRHRQPDGFCRAGMDTGQTGLAAARNLYSPPVLHMNGTGGTDLLADPAADTSVAYPDQVLPGIRRLLPGKLKELAVRRPVRVGDWRDLVLSGLQIRKDFGQLPFHVLVLPFFFLHIKGGQPIAKHPAEQVIRRGALGLPGRLLISVLRHHGRPGRHSHPGPGRCWPPDQRRSGAAWRRPVCRLRQGCFRRR